MKTAASVFSWLGGIVSTIIGFVFLSNGRTFTTYEYNEYLGTYLHVDKTEAYSTGIWVFWIFLVVFRFAVLIWRQNSVESGNKVGCGIMTLLFASVIGGILTLCIPEYELYKEYELFKYNRPSRYINSDVSKTGNQKPNETSLSKMTETERVDIIERYKKLLDEGAITQEEFDNKKKELL